MPTLTELPHWTIHTSGGEVTFARRDREVRATPRVWDGHGLALHQDDLPGFAKALGEIMKLPAYWRARARSASGGERLWSAPRPGADGFVYVTGPCRRTGDDSGYRPAESFTFDLTAVRDLRVRIAAHLQARRTG